MEMSTEGKMRSSGMETNRRMGINNNGIETRCQMDGDCNNLKSLFDIKAM
jgi:hypothetical protein